MPTSLASALGWTPVCGSAVAPPSQGPQPGRGAQDSALRSFQQHGAQERGLAQVAGAAPGLQARGPRPWA